MQVGDLVRFCRQPDPAVGVIVDIDILGRLGISWSFLDGRIGWQSRQEVEVVAAAS
jgi:hypothetical protein